MMKSTQKSVKFDWGEKAEAAFQLLKQKLCSASILALPKGSENFAILSAQSKARKEENFINEDLHGVINKLEPSADETLCLNNRSWIPCFGKFEGKVDEGFLVVRHLRGPEWLFDIDSLTSSMNYEPVTIENQTNNDACIEINANVRKARQEKASDHEYVLLLFTPSSTQNSKDKDVGEVPNKGDDGVSKRSNNDDQDKTDSSTQDVGAEDDTNNLELSTVVSPIPTTKVHKDHPKEHIIEDLNLETQTRRMLNFSKENAMKKPYMVFIKLLEPGMKHCLQVYVDEIIFGSTKKSLCDEFEQMMHKRFQMSSVGELTFFLRLQVTQKDDEIFTSQEKFQVTPKASHIHVVKRIFKYLKGQPKLGLWYPRDSPFDLEAFSDSDYARASLDRKSTTGEYVAAASCCEQVLWIQNQMLDYGFNLINIKIYIDNENLTFWLLALDYLISEGVFDMVKTVNDDVRLQALVDGKKVVVNEASIRCDLRLDDAEGTACLPNADIFKELVRMGYEKPSQKLTFYKAFFSPQWKFLIHTILVLSLKETKTNQAAKNEKLKKRVKKLEGKKKKSTHGLKKLYKGRIADIDADKDLSLINETVQDQERMNDQDLFGVYDLDGDEVFVDVTTTKNVEHDATVAEMEVTSIEDIEAKDKGKGIMVEPEKPLKKKDINIEIMEESLKKNQVEVSKGSSKRVGEELEQESAKKQKLDEQVQAKAVDDDTAELKRCLEIVPEDDDVAIEATPLSFKSPTIVDYKIYIEGKKSYFKIIRAYGNP
nr:hypothetical protein [Tanacetum cinerariifolium]